VSSADLELEFDAVARLAGVDAAESLEVRVETARRHLGDARLYRLDERVVDEHVLVLGLHHVVALRAQARHVTVHVQRLLVSNAFQHRVDDDHGTGPTHAGAATTRDTVINFHVLPTGRNPFPRLSTGVA